MAMQDRSSTLQHSMTAVARHARAPDGMHWCIQSVPDTAQQVQPLLALRCASAMFPKLATDRQEVQHKPGAVQSAGITATLASTSVVVPSAGKWTVMHTSHQTS